VSGWGGESIHNAILSQLASAPLGKKITKLALTWNSDGTLQTLKVYDGNELLFTLTFTWNDDGTLAQVERT
jgi:hypothetical protein